MSVEGVRVKFEENRDMFALPEPANSPMAPHQTVDIKSNFNAVAPNPSTSVNALAPGMNKVDMQNLQLQTQALREPAQGIKAPISELGGESMKMGMELGGAIANIFGGPKSEPDQDLVANASVPQYQPTAFGL